MRLSAYLFSVIASLPVLLNTCQQAGETSSGTSVGTTTQTESKMFHTPDTAAIHALLRTADKIVFTQTDTAIARYLQVLNWSKQMHYFSSAATAYRNLAFCYQQKGNYRFYRLYLDEAIAYLEQAIPTARLLHRYTEVRKIYTALIYCYELTNAYPKVIATYQKASSYFNERDTSQKIPLLTIRRQLASALFFTGQYDSASNVYVTMLPLLKPATPENHNLLGYTYIGMAAIASRLSSPEKAIAYYRQAVDLGQKFEDTAMQINALGNIGTLYQEQRDFEQAKRYAFAALNLSAQTRALDVQSRAQFQNNYIIAASLMQEGQPEAALKYSELTFQKALQTNSALDKAMGLYLIGSNYTKLRQYKKAERYLQEGLRLAKAINMSDQVSAGFGQLGIVYARLGQYKKAYNFHSAYITMRDSLRSQEISAHISEMDTRYRVSEKDKLLAQNKLQLATQQLKIRHQYILAGIISAAAIFIILILMLVLRRRKHRAELERLKARMAGEEQERTRMARELHDGIVSRLSIIKTNLCALPQPHYDPGEQDALQDVIAQLDQGIAELRTTSHNLLPEILKQAGLAEAVHIYCEKIRQTGKLDIDFQLVGRIPSLTADFQLNVYRIIQELIHNIIKHAHASTALIQFSGSAENLEITIDDNGSTAYTGDSGGEQGIGLYNLHSRLQLLGGSMETERTEGTSVYLTFNLKPFIVSET